MATRRYLVLPASLLCLALVSCVDEPSGPRFPAPGAEISASAAVAVLAGAGDIADCTRTGDSLTANLLDDISGTVFTAGDNAYEDGSSADYANCYEPTWGRHKARTRPVPGNHDYNTSGAAGYFGYFGDAAGDPAKGYYSYDLGTWHIIALNSNIAMGAGSAQEQWLRADLAAHPAACTLAYWHHPLFSSSTVPVLTAARAAWRDLYDAGAELVINGHHHNYERFGPQTPAGAVDRTFGIREIVVGTGGGGGLFSFGATAPNSEVRDNETFGVLKLTLRPRDYDWEFIPVAGKTFRDSGRGACHDAPSSSPTANQPPTAVPGGAYTGTEGEAVRFDGSGSSDPDGDALTYTWSFGDGTRGSGATPTHTYADNGSYTVALTVTDTHAATSAPATATVTIANAAPDVNAGPSQTVGIPAEYTLNATFHDPGANDAPWSFAIDWGDVTPPTTGSTTNQADAITARHLYLLPGTYTVRVTVTDKDGGSRSATTTVTVDLSLTTQTITFDAIPVHTYGDAPFGVSATAGSGLPVSFSAAGGCTMSGGSVSITAAGTCTVTAHQAGDATYAPAADVARSFAVLYNTAVGHTLLPPIARSQAEIMMYQVGATIPVKFQLFYPDGVTPVGTARASTRVVLMATATSGPLDEIVASASPNQGLAYRFDGDQYVFNLATDTWQPGIHQIIVTLDDGSTMVGMVGSEPKTQGQP